MIERHFAKPLEKVFAALADPAKKQRWYGVGPHERLLYEMDFRLGGVERARWRMDEKTPFPGVEMANDGVHLDIVPDKRVVIASTMAIAGRPMSASLCTFELAATQKGTSLIFTHQGAFFENSDGPDMRKAGWNDLLDKLGREVAAA